MSAQKPSAKTLLGALGAFVGMSVVAGLLVTAAVTPAVAVTGMAANDSIGVFEGLPEYLKLDQLPQNTTVYATQGGKQVPIASFYAQNRVAAKWGDIAQTAKDAAISAEDPRFYQHGGVDIQGTIRGALSTFLTGDTQGGSSITQQYVKNVLVQKCELLDQPGKANQAKFKTCYQDATETTPDRKLKEMKMAIGLEKKYSKDTILLNYLNIAGFGGSVYGIQSAARYYYDVDAKNLSVAQAASLIAIFNNPSVLKLDDPTSTTNGAKDGYAANKARRDYIIGKMYDNKKITKQQRDEAIATKIEPKITPQSNGCSTAAKYNAAFFCDYVTNVIRNDPAFGKTSDDRYASFLRGGFKIYTTLDLDLQATAQKSLSDYIPPSEPGMDLGASSVSTELGTGRILTMVQNRPYNNTATPVPGTTAINYNTDSDYGNSQGFQTGSTYKAFTLAEWLKEGHSLNDVINASQHDFPQSLFHSSCAGVGGPDWNVTNDEGSASSLNVLNATAESVNTAFAMMGTQLDLCGIKNTAESLGVHTGNPVNSDGSPNTLDANPSSILGTNYISPLTMATAYAGFGDKGTVCTAVAIDKVVNADGSAHPLTPTKCTQGLDPKVAAGVAYALTGVMTHGTATSANPFDGTPILGKTGTTDDSYDNWLVTSTTKVSTATWVGNVEGVKNGDGPPVKTALRDKEFQGIGGGDVKFAIAKPILAAIDAKFGGDQFPPVESSMLYGVQIGIPDLSGKTPDQAKSTLENLGLGYKDGGATDGAQPPGQVTKTDPAAGTNVSKGTVVTVYTSNGSAVAVPNNLVGMTLSQAQTALAQLGLAANAAGSNAPDSVVTATNPAAGTIVKKGSVVTLAVKAAAQQNNNNGTTGTGGDTGNGTDPGTVNPPGNGQGGTGQTGTQN